MQKVADEGDFTVEQIQLCDVLWAYGKGRDHVSLVTDILRDETGRICWIEVSEAISPTCTRRLFEAETFLEAFKLFALCRYDHVDQVPMPDAVQNELLKQGVNTLPAVAVDYGNKTNYRANEEVVISAFGEGENELELYCNGKVIERITITGRGKVHRNFDRGYYRVKHVITGETVEFCVTRPQISHSVENGRITVRVNSCDSESVISHMEFREISRSEREREAGIVSEVYHSPKCASLAKVEELTDEEKATGVIIREIPEDAANFKIYFENRYGVWTHTMIRI